MTTETREVFITWPQSRALGEEQNRRSSTRRYNSVGVYLQLDVWDARELYEKAVALPMGNAHQADMRRRILEKLFWALPSYSTPKEK